MIKNSQKKIMLNRQVLAHIKLEDDNTPYGGVETADETALDFCDSIYAGFDWWEKAGEVELSELNKLLKECGIKQISLDNVNENRVA